MNEKSWYLSKTLWGVVIMVLGQLLAVFKIDLGLTGESQTQFVDILVNAIIAVAQVVGALLAIIGRFTAKTKLAISSPKPPTTSGG